MQRGFRLPLWLVAAALLAAGPTDSAARSDPYHGTVTSVSADSGWIGIDDQVYRVSPDAIIENGRNTEIDLSEFRAGDRIVYSLAPVDDYGTEWIVRIRRAAPGNNPKGGPS